METPANAPDPARTAPPHDALLVEPFGVTAISRQVAVHRGVELHSPVRVAEWDEATLFHRRGPANESSKATAGAELSRDVGLAQVSNSVIARLPELLEKGISGLYDQRTKLIRIQSRAGDTEQERAWTLVHEIEHALQDQSSRLARSPQNADEALALRALISGDAEITTAAFIASRHLSFDHWLAQLLAHARDPLAHAAAFRGAPDFVRRQWLFPYMDGTLLVGSLYRAGGYELVNRTFEHPPVSTEQVLHPEKYFAGEMPVSVPIPAAPEGYAVIATGVMGELRARGLVAPCDDAHADDTSVGWGGDAYAIVTDGGKRRAVLWNTVWDDEDSARRFDASLRAGDACIRKRLGEEAAPQDATVVGDGVRVAYVRGLSAPLSEATARALLSVPVERPVADRPLGNVRLRPIADPQSFVGQGSLRAGRYVSDPLGLSLPVQGFDVIETTLSDELTLERYFGLSNVGPHRDGAPDVVDAGHRTTHGVELRGPPRGCRCSHRVHGRDGRDHRGRARSLRFDGRADRARTMPPSSSRSAGARSRSWSGPAGAGRASRAKFSASCAKCGSTTALRRAGSSRRTRPRPPSPHR